MKFEVCGFEHLHLHTDFSLLDGYGMVEEYAERWKSHGKYLCISDHGMMAAIPRQIKACDKQGLSPLFAVELYVNPLQIEYDTKADLDHYIKSLDPDQQKIMRKKGYHLLAIAHNEVGYSNLVHLTSLAWTKGYYYRPRVNHEQLLRYKEGIFFTSCCYASEIAQAFDKGGEEAGFAMIEKYIAMFGKDNFFLEIMLLDFEKQKPYDEFICKAHEKFGLPIILTNDCHYCQQEDSKMQQLMLMIQTGNTFANMEKKKREEGMQDFFELQDTNLWMKSEDDLNAKWLSDYSHIIDYEIFKQAKRNTVEICRMAEGVKLDRSIKLPQIPNANERLKEEAINGYKRRQLPQNSVYKNRLKEELELIRHKDFASYFLIVQMITDEARRICPKLLGWGTGVEAVGPGRGSAVGSLVCYCLGITDVDPIKHDLLFSRFLNPARGGRSIRFRF